MFTVLASGVISNVSLKLWSTFPCLGVNIPPGNESRELSYFSCSLKVCLKRGGASLFFEIWRQFSMNPSEQAVVESRTGFKVFSNSNPWLFGASFFFLELFLFVDAFFCIRLHSLVRVLVLAGEEAPRG